MYIINRIPNITDYPQLQENYLFTFLPFILPFYPDDDDNNDDDGEKKKLCAL